jgi:malate dehydrogenase (oxaloacetate-decarboxylating)(NADP+)
MFLTAAETLSAMVTDWSISSGQIYPPLASIRDVSKNIAVAVARQAESDGLMNSVIPDNLNQHIDKYIYKAVYTDYT